MSNTNCLAGIACPRCQFDEYLEVAVTGFVTLTDNGYSEYPRNCNYDENSYMRCPDCGHEGSVADFMQSAPGEEEPMTDSAVHPDPAPADAGEGQ